MKSPPDVAKIHNTAMPGNSPDINAAIRHLKKSDPVMRDIIAHVGKLDFRIRRRRFATLVNSIISQQISGAAAATIRRRLRSLLGGSFTPARLASFDEKDFRSIGISRQKASYIADLTHKVNSGTVNLRKIGRYGNEEVIQELTQIRGIGVWTAQMFLMFSLERLDVLPTGDLGIQKAMKLHYRIRGKPTPARMKKIAQPWNPFETIASCYLWRSLDD